MWACLSLAAGYRWFGDGLDFNNYVDFYDRLGVSRDIGHERYEPGFTGLAWLFKSVGASYGTYATVLAGTSLAIKFQLIYRRTRWPILAILAYCGIFYPIHEYTQIRAAVAIAFALVSVEYYLNARYWSAMVWLALGILFHSQVALVAIVMSIFWIIRQRPNTAIFCLVAIALFSTTVATSALAESVVALFPQAIEQLIVAQDDEAVTFLSGANLLAVAAIVSLLIFDDQLDQAQQYNIFSCTMGLLILYLLLDVPVFALRLHEMLNVPIIFMAFRFKPGSPAMAAGVFVLLIAGTSLATAISAGILG